MNHLRILNVGDHKIAANGFNEHLTTTPVVFLHGVTYSLNYPVHGNLPSLDNQRWYSLGLPGHYPSEFPKGFKPEDLTPELIADLIYDALVQLVGNQPVTLVGHSTGGFAALAVAARYPQRVKAVASVSGFAHGYWLGIFRSLQKLARAGLPGQALFKLSGRLLTSSQSVFKSASFGKHEVDNQDFQAMYADAKHLNGDAMVAYFNRMPDIDITTWLPAIQTPTLVLAGDHDTVVPVEQARLIAEHVPNSTLHWFTGGGHLPMIEQPAVYREVLSDWLSRHLQEIHPAVRVELLPDDVA